MCEAKIRSDIRYRIVFLRCYGVKRDCDFVERPAFLGENDDVVSFTDKRVHRGISDVVGCDVNYVSHIVAHFAELQHSPYSSSASG